MHLHAFSFELSGRFSNVFTNSITGRSYRPALTADAQRDETLDRMETYHVVKAMVSGSAAGAWYDGDPGRFLVGSMIDTRRSDVDSLREQHAAGRLHAIGEMGPYYEGLRADDPAVAPFFDLANELGIPAAYHLFPGGGPGSVYAGGMMAGIRAANANPIQIEDVLLARPGMKLYVMHAGWPYLEDMKALMYAHPQLYVGIGGINWLVPTAEFHAFLKGLIDAGYGRRILFGTDQMGWPAAIDDAFRAVDSASFLTDEQKADIFYHNAARFLELPQEEIEGHWSAHPR